MATLLVGSLAIALAGCGGAGGSGSAGTAGTSSTNPTTIADTAASGTASGTSGSTTSGVSTGITSGGGSTSGGSTGITSGGGPTSGGSTTPPPAPPPANTSVTLGWQAPTENTNGTPITDLAGYKIHYGIKSADYTQVVSINNAGLTRYVVDNLPKGTYYFAITAYNSKGLESDLSGEVTSTVD